jgi:hypothetical protein
VLNNVQKKKKQNKKNPPFSNFYPRSSVTLPCVLSEADFKNPPDMLMPRVGHRFSTLLAILRKMPVL